MPAKNEEYKLSVEELYEKLDVISFYRKFFPDFKTNGQREVLVLCPFHDDRKPSLAINIETGKWYCHACGFGGDPLEFLERRENLDFKEALKALAEFVGQTHLDLGKKGVSREKKKSRQKLPPPTPEELAAYQKTLWANKNCLSFLLKERGLSKEVIRRFKLGFDPARKAYVIPLFEGEKLVAFRRYRPGVKENRFSWQGKFEGLFGLSSVKNTSLPVILCEGEMDALCAISRGFQAVSGTHGAPTFKPQWAESLRGLDVVIAYDQDKAGRDGALKAAQALLETAARVRVISWPEFMEEGQDLTDFFVKHRRTPEDFLDLMAHAREIGCEELDGLRFRSPSGYRVTKRGIFYVKETKNEVKEVCLAPAPILITGRTVYLEDNREELELTFWRAGRWQKITAPRGDVLHGRHLVTLAHQGLPVSSRTANRLSSFLLDFEHANLPRLPVRLAVTSCGWKTLNEEKFFVLGKEVFPEHLRDRIALCWDPEYSQTVNALTTKGELKKILAVIKELPKLSAWHALFVWLAALTPPVIRLLEVPGFLVSVYQNSSKGKTTSSMLAASSWGYPDDSRGLLFSWNATATFFERQAAFLCDLPFFLEDSQRLKEQNPKLLQDAIYFLATGQGKGRGTITSIQRRSSWQLVTISTGEDSLTDHSPYEGVKARTLSLYGLPFGEAKEEFVRQIRSLVLENYGHVGRVLLRHLVRIAQDEEALLRLRARYEELCAAYPRFESHHLAPRLATYVAAVHVTGEILSELLPELDRKTFEEACGRAYEATIKDLDAERDLPRKALELVREWVASNQHSFPYKEDYLHSSEKKECFGFIEPKQSLCIFPRHLSRLFESENIPERIVLKEWKERGWLRADADGHLKRRVYLGPDQARTRMVVLSWEAYVGQGGEP